MTGYRMEAQFLAREHLLASYIMGSPPQNAEDRSVEQILNEVVPLRSRKLALVSRPWTLVLIVVVIVCLIAGFAIYWN
jgi:hypothetical protein